MRRGGSSSLDGGGGGGVGYFDGELSVGDLLVIVEEMEEHGTNEKKG